MFAGAKFPSLASDLGRRPSSPIYIMALLERIISLAVSLCIEAEFWKAAFFAKRKVMQSPPKRYIEVSNVGSNIIDTISL